MGIPREWRKRILVLFVVADLAGFIGLPFSTAGPFRSVSGRGVSASEANARLWNCLVPTDATDVWYKSYSRGTQVEYTLGPESFEAWCKARGWRLTPIVEPAYISSQRDGFRNIDGGLRFREMDRDLGFFGLYDSEGCRAYVTYSGN